VLAVADVFDALVSDRPYRAGLSVSSAVAIIEHGTGSHFDPRPVAAFLEAVRAGAIDVNQAMQSSAMQLASSVSAGRRAMEDAA
jgi:HD-GYP domain-containing protein (c-di-GMP phosphodiesterase class II)